MARCESQLVIPVLETGTESTAQQQPQEQQQQFETKEKWMVFGACRDDVELETRGEEQEKHLQLPPKEQQSETGEKGWLKDLVVKPNFEQYLPCSVGAPAAEPVDVWARDGVGARWLVAVEDAGCGRHGHPQVENPSPACARLRQ